jgi:hypothetical protein
LIPGIVECGVQPTVGNDGLLDHPCHLEPCP